MNTQWEYAEVALEKIGWPGWGWDDRWRWWFHRSWTLLHEAGWFDKAWRGDGSLPGPPDAPDPRDPPNPRLTLVALRWIAEDFAAEADGDPDFFNPSWDEWLDAVKIDREAALRWAAALPGWLDVDEQVKFEVGDPYDADHLDLDGEPAWDAANEYESALKLQAAMLMARRLRPPLLRTLKNGWGDEMRLFQSLWACGGPEETAGDDAGDELGDQSPGLTDPDSTWAGNAMLTVSEGEAVNAQAQAAFDDVDLYDEQDNIRANALGWALQGCVPRVAGSPVLFDVEE